MGQGHEPGSVRFELSHSDDRQDRRTPVKGGTPQGAALLRWQRVNHTSHTRRERTNGFRCRYHGKDSETCQRATSAARTASRNGIIAYSAGFLPRHGVHPGRLRIPHPSRCCYDDRKSRDRVQPAAYAAASNRHALATTDRGITRRNRGSGLPAVPPRRGAEFL